MSDILLPLQILLACVFFIAAIINDLLHEKIPNKLCLMAIIIGLTLNTYYGHVHGFLNSFYGLSLAFTILIPAFVFRVLGAGDIKLMMGIGALIGPMLLFWSLLYGIAAGTVTSLLLIIWRTGLTGIKKTCKRYWDCIYLRHYFKPESDEAAGQRIPYAPALGLGWVIACVINLDITHIYAQWAQYLGS